MKLNQSLNPSYEYPVFLAHSTILTVSVNPLFMLTNLPIGVEK